MAVIEKGILGGIVGNIGQVSGQRLGGKAVIKSKKGKLNQSNMVSGQTQNVSFKGMNNFWALSKGLLNEGFDLAGIGSLYVPELLRSYSLVNGSVFYANMYNGFGVLYDGVPNDVESLTYYHSGQNAWIVRFENLNVAEFKLGALRFVQLRYIPNYSNWRMRTRPVTQNQVELFPSRVGSYPKRLSLVIGYLIDANGVRVSDVLTSMNLDESF